MIVMTVKWENRTSQTHPIRIDWISHQLFPGKIGLTICPGKYQPVSQSGGWNRDLETDVSRIAIEEVSTVISLVEPEEMEMLHVPSLGECIENNGMNWFHLPNQDTTAPDKEWLNQFTTTLPAIIEAIKRGEKIVVHCKGGLSRAGTTVALILHNFGIEMSEAVSLIRRVRSRSCINPIQYKFLMTHSDNSGEVVL